MLSIPYPLGDEGVYLLLCSCETNTFHKILSRFSDGLLAHYLRLPAREKQPSNGKCTLSIRVSTA